MRNDRRLKKGIKLARGRILDVGCGSGRHSLYLQGKGFDITGVDFSPGAIEVCRLRGLRKAFAPSVSEAKSAKKSAAHF